MSVVTRRSPQVILAALRSRLSIVQGRTDVDAHHLERLDELAAEAVEAVSAMENTLLGAQLEASASMALANYERRGCERVGSESNVIPFLPTDIRLRHETPSIIEVSPKEPA